MQIVTQVAIFLENLPGALARVCDALAAAHINILAMAIGDSIDHAVVRMVVSDPRKAIFLLEEGGAMVVETEVLMIEGDNHPGSLARLAEALAAAEINIEYLYAASPARARRSLTVMRVADPERAKAILQPLSRQAVRRKSPRPPARR